MLVYVPVTVDGVSVSADGAAEVPPAIDLVSSLLTGLPARRCPPTYAARAAPCLVRRTT